MGIRNMREFATLTGRSFADLREQIAVGCVGLPAILLRRDAIRRRDAVVEPINDTTAPS